MYQLQDALKRRLRQNLPSPRKTAIESNVYHQIDAIRRYMHLAEKTKVLEVGCGSGVFTFHLDRHCQVTGIDTQRDMLTKNPVKRTALMDACHLAFEDDSFDIVFCRHVLHHIPQVHDALAEMKRVARKLVVLAEPNRYHPLNLFTGLLVSHERGTLRYTEGYLNKLAEAHGLEVLESSTYGFLVPELTPKWLSPIMRMTRMDQPLGFESLLVTRKLA